jgi:hypothetical protein
MFLDRDGGANPRVRGDDRTGKDWRLCMGGMAPSAVACFTWVLDG